MFRKISVLTTVCLLGLLLSECKTSKSTASKPVTAPAPTSNTPSPEEIASAIADGKTVYELKCHQCHAEPIVSKYTKDEWPDLMDKMAKKSHLSEVEKMHAMAFVLAGGK